MRKIYVILLIALTIKLIHITYPVLGWHSWRQSDTASIARNFHENGYNILYPQINWGGTGTGYVESEFHIYPFIVALLYRVFGQHDFLGRVVSLIFSILTVYGLYLLVRRYINEETALWSALIYTILPLNIFYGRAFMPEATMLMCSVYSIYFFSRWLDEEKTKYFLFTLIFTTLAILIKLPTMYLGLPMLYLAFQKHRFGLFKNYRIYMLVVLIFLPVVLWYHHAHQLFLNGGSSFGIWTYGQDKWGTFTLLFDPAWYNDIFFKSIAERHLTYPGFILMLFGLFIKREHKSEKLFDVWLIAILLYIFIAAQAHRAQEYYTLPFDIAASVFIAKFLAKYIPMSSITKTFSAHRLKATFAVICVVLICILSYLRVARFLNGESMGSAVLKIGSDMKSLSNINDKVISVSSGNPSLLYHAHRTGWTVYPVQIDSVFLNKKKHEGAKWIIAEKSEFENNKANDKLEYLMSNFKIMKNEKDYVILAVE
jgi:4-amino-4-deoxy-L-arabinose transferase-like glycosyltransferase